MFTYMIVGVAFTAIYLISVFSAARLRSVQLQREVPVLRPIERARLESLLIDAYCQRVTEDQPFLKAFLDDYLGNASAVKRQIWDQLTKDPNSIRDIVTEALSQKTEERLVMAYAENSKYVPKHVAFLDPNLRLSQLDDSRTLFTHVQSRVSLIGFLILLFMILVPPWIRQDDDVTWVLWSITSREVSAEAFLGYGFILSTPLPDEIEYVSTGNLGSTRQKRKRTVVAMRVLVPQLLLVTILFPIATYWMRKANTTTQNSPRDPS